MNKYKEIKEFNYAVIAAEILTFWKEHQIFEKSITNRKEAQSFTFYEGPPSANGTPGIHHVMARTVKDIFCRYKTLQGYQVRRKGGWDTHGLPVELQVEKELGITKDDIGRKISIEEYNRKCRETVMKYKDQWDNLTIQMGYWVDLKNPYITYEKEYIESLWWILKKIYDKNLLYKGYTIQPYSPSDGTGLSSHELNQPGCYKNVKDTSVVAQFKLIEDEKFNQLFSNDREVFVLAWTTTPWTLPSNTALTIGERIQYVQVYTFNPYTFTPISVILAKDLVGKYFPEKNSKIKLTDYKKGDKTIPFEIGKEFEGKELIGLKYEQLMPYVKPYYAQDKAFQIIAGDFVTTEDGTGVVHTSPTFGADDFRVAKQNGVPALTVKDDAGNEMPIVDKKGKFIKQIAVRLMEGVSKYHIKTHRLLGENDFYVKNYTDEDETHPEYKNTDVIISIILKEENKAFKVEKYEHTYPHSWRTDKPILYYPLDAWFIKTTALKDKMVKLNKTINWKPESTGVGRFGNWLENLVDWNLSRSRYWGTPLPIWRTQDGKEEICIGSIEQLNQEVERARKAGIKNETFGDKNFDLHRPYVDEIILVSATGKPMHRESDLIDVWFDSGAMPYAQWHYPFENKDIFEKSYPADYISEGVDQTRGWFFTLHALAALLSETSTEIQTVNQKVGNGGVAFKNVISTGLVLDKEGNKMSKRKGNVVDPYKMLNKYGADIVRWYMIENAPPWDNLKFDIDGIEETQRRFFGTLMNTYSFFAMYANIDGFEKEEKNNIPFNRLALLDKWIITQKEQLIEEVTAAYEQYEPTRAARAIQQFVNDDLSNWYVRLNRKRFWQPTSAAAKGGIDTLLTDDKRAAYETLYECIMTTVQLMSPIAPFISEWLYKHLTESIRNKATHTHIPLPYESIHHTIWKKANASNKDLELQHSMNYAQRICSLIHSVRKNTKIKVRTPLQKVLLPVLDAQFANRIKQVDSILKAEVNVKNIEYIDDTSDLLIKKAKPNFAKLGKQYGAKMKAISAVINTLAKEEISTLEKTGKITKGGFDLVLEDVLISSEDIAGWAVATEGDITVALDLTITEELKREGVARDFVNRIQKIRKDMGMDVLDKIVIELEDEQVVYTQAVNEFKQYICTETQAVSLKFANKIENAVDIDMDEFVIKGIIKKA